MAYDFDALIQNDRESREKKHLLLPSSNICI